MASFFVFRKVLLMTIELWLSFCLTETVLCLMPGPAVLLVVSQALARGARPALLASLGILTANAMYFVLAAGGVGTALVASHNLFMAMKWAGAAYLIYLGLKMILMAPGAEGDPRPLPTSRSFLHGFVVQGANPKALIFFTALLPQFIDPHVRVGSQMLILGISSVVIELAVLAFYVQATVRSYRLYGSRLGRHLPKAGGAVLVAAGLRLASIRSE
jgi:homoserine/homoserine lactone efflux protein